MNIDKEKLKVNVDLGKLRESLKAETPNKIDILRSINDLISSLGYMKVKVIESIDPNMERLARNQNSSTSFDDTMI